MHLRVETITKNKAMEYLATNLENQRHVKTQWVNQLASMMLAGTYNGLNGETIKFGKVGKKDVLIDGQHRLHAIVEYGKPVEMAVLRGVDSEAFKTLDQGFHRTVENFYQIANQSYAKVCAQVAKWMFYAEHTGNPLRWASSSPRPVPGLIAEWGLSNHPELPDILEPVQKYLSEFQKCNLGTKNYAAFCYYQWQAQDQILAYEAIKYLATGAGDVPLTIRSLREYLIREGAADQKNAIPGTKRGLKVINAMNTAWNLMVKDKKRNVKSMKRHTSKFDASVLRHAGQTSDKPALCL